MSKLNLKKYKCSVCTGIIGPTDEYIRKCEGCGSTLLEKQDLMVKDFLRFIEQELESANHHDYIELPEKLFNSICNIPEIPITLERELAIAKIIAEEFYNNI